MKVTGLLGEDCTCTHKHRLWFRGLLLLKSSHEPPLGPLHEPSPVIAQKQGRGEGVVSVFTSHISLAPPRRVLLARWADEKTEGNVEISQQAGSRRDSPLLAGLHPSPWLGCLP